MDSQTTKMDGFAFIVIFILLSVGARGENNREERGLNHRRPNNNFRQRHFPIRPISVRGNQGHSHKFRNKFGDGLQIKVILPSSWFNENADQQVPLHEAAAPEQQQAPVVDQAQTIPSSSSNDENAVWPINQDGIQFGGNDDAELEDSSFGISPRISISDYGDITLGRSLNFDKLKSFHDDDNFKPNHDDHDHILDEELDHNQKSLRASKNLRQHAGRPEQLAATLAGLQGNLEVLHTINSNQGDNGGDVLGSTEGSNEGAITTSGMVSVTSSGGSNGFKSTLGNSQTEQGITVGNSAHAGDHLAVTASGIAVNVNSSGSSTTSGTGTSSSSGTSSVVTSGGWKSSQSSPQTFQGASVNNGAQAGESLDIISSSGTGVTFSNSGSSSVTGSGTITSSGISNVYTSGSSN